jgi:CDP-diacylglycerol pyrophosphatase
VRQFIGTQAKSLTIDSHDARTSRLHHLHLGSLTQPDFLESVQHVVLANHSRYGTGATDLQILQGNQIVHVSATEKASVLLLRLILKSPSF